MELGEGRVRITWQVELGVNVEKAALGPLGHPGGSHAPQCRLGLPEQADGSGCLSQSARCSPGRVTGGPCAALTCVSHCLVFPGLGLGLLLPATRALQPLPRDAALQPAGRQLPAQPAVCRFLGFR